MTAVLVALGAAGALSIAVAVVWALRGVRGWRC